MKKEFEAISKIIESNKRVLDVGCGDGTLMEYLKEKQKNDVRGLEPQKILYKNVLLKVFLLLKEMQKKNCPSFQKNHLTTLCLAKHYKLSLIPKKF